MTLNEWLNNSYILMKFSPLNAIRFNGVEMDKNYNMKFYILPIK